MNAKITIKIETVNGLEYANLGKGNLAEATTMFLEATNGGHHIVKNDEVLYHNGAANEEIYQEMVAKAQK